MLDGPGDEGVELGKEYGLGSVLHRGGIIAMIPNRPDFWKLNLGAKMLNPIEANLTIATSEEQDLFDDQSTSGLERQCTWMDAYTSYLMVQSSNCRIGWPGHGYVV